MPYATLSDLVERFGQDEIDGIADITGDGVREADTVKRAGADADAEIDAALSLRYKVPLRPVPLLVKRIACDLMRERLYTLNCPDTVRDFAKAARVLLKSLATGESVLPCAVASEDAPAGGMVEMVSGRGHSPFASPVARRRS